MPRCRCETSSNRCSPGPASRLPRRSRPAASPLATAGRDITGVAQTGTGKTLAFLVPIFDALEPCDDVQAMVICPTRELAQQVGSVARDIGEPLGVKTAVLYGGTSLGGQQNELRELPDVVVGTPGRLMDFLSSAWLRPRRLRWLVLDEADRMLDMGFIDDVVKICSRLPLSRQTMLFSATMPPPIEELTSRFMYEPEVVRIDAQTRVAAGGGPLPVLGSGTRQGKGPGSGDGQAPRQEGPDLHGDPRGDQPTGGASPPPWS
ncbi:MAG: DEAD/DEAH box helicase [Acidobacteriota bacterium]|nr:DEAD/DEAH box helicase [Acidobacteriota bacterium]